MTTKTTRILILGGTAVVLAGAFFVVPALIGRTANDEAPVSEIEPIAEVNPGTEVESTGEAEPDAEARSAIGSTEVEPTVALTDSDKGAVTEFDKQTRGYEGLHKRLEGTLPKLPEKATPEQIDQHQKAMSALIRAERKDAKPGEFFTPAIVALAKRATSATVAGTDGKENEEAIMAENPGTLPNVNVNDRYPDGAPVTSMPVELLQTLPELPGDLEYRFLGKRLALVDTCCQLVLDITPSVLP